MLQRATRLMRSTRLMSMRMPATSSSSRAWFGTTSASAASASASASANNASTSNTNGTTTTHFGFHDVPIADKVHMVGSVFHKVAQSYDLMNDVMSVGIHRLWKHHLMQVVSPTVHTQMLDVAGGTGDIAFRFIEEVYARAAPPALSAPLSWLPVGFRPSSSSSSVPSITAKVIVCDINPSMLGVGRERAIQYGYLSPDAQVIDPSVESSSSNTLPMLDPRTLPSSSSSSPSSSSSSRRKSAAAAADASSVGIDFVVGNAEQLPFPDQSFDVYTIAFGLRNVTDTDAALREAYRVLRPGGRFLCMEFSQLPNPLMQQAYDAYSFNVIPLMGELIAQDRASYQYLVESIRKFPNQEELTLKLQRAGFRGCTYENLTMGITAIHSGFRV